MYRHTQRSPLHVLLYLPAVFSFFVAWLARDNRVPSLTVIGLGVVLLLLALSFQTLTVSDDGEELDVRYGPLNLFGTRIAYRDITSVKQGQTSWINGWGIHFVPFRGWTLNLWGFDCVEIERSGKIIRIGSDDSQSLAEMIEQKIQGHKVHASKGSSA